MPDTPEMIEAKRAMRATARAERARIAPSADLEDALVAPVLALKTNWQNVVVAGYMPIRHELSPLAVLEALAAHGAHLALPAVIPPDQMVFRAYDDHHPLEAGFAETLHPPATSPVVQPDVVLVPLLAFDRKGTRLGYGGGHYDRALMRLRADHPDALAVGIAYGEQMCLFPLPFGAYDQRLDLVITPQQVFDFRP